MRRAELRRQKREQEKKTKTLVMTADELQKIRQQEFDRAKKLLMDRNDELTQEI